MQAASWQRRLARFYGLYTIGFIGFVSLLLIAEGAGLPNRYTGYAFLFATILLYAVIGLTNRTTDLSEYYVAGRRVPPVFNGMATAADWMSAASFLGLAGGLYLQGYDGLAYVMGWTGGYVLVALLLAPFLRRFGEFTIPDFLGARYASNAVPVAGALAAILDSFVYVVAQIYAVGLITRRFTGLDFQVGVFVGLTGILVCSFLGGMRAITWTQVAQYIIILIAYMIPVVMLSVKHTGSPFPQLVYGSVLQKLTEREKQLDVDAAELDVRQRYLAQAKALQDRVARLPESYDEARRAVHRHVQTLRPAQAPPRQ